MAYLCSLYLRKGDCSQRFTSKNGLAIYISKLVTL